MLSLKLNEKNKFTDPFAILNWAEDDLEFAVALEKSKGPQGTNVVNERILIGSNAGILARLHDASTAPFPAEDRKRTYTIGELVAEFSRQSVRTIGSSLHLAMPVARDIQRRGYATGVVCDQELPVGSFLRCFTHGYSDFAEGGKLFRRALAWRIKPLYQDAEKQLRTWLRKKWAGDPVEKFMALWLWQKYCATILEANHELRAESADAVLAEFHRLAGAFWDAADEIHPQGQKLMPDDLYLRGTALEDPKTWELRNKSGVAYPGEVMFLGNTFQGLKWQYYAAMQTLNIQYRRCLTCNGWFAALNGATLCSPECKIARKKAQDKNYSQKRKEDPTDKKWQESQRINNTNLNLATEEFGPDDAVIIRIKKRMAFIIKDGREFRKKWRQERDPAKKAELVEKRIKNIAIYKNCIASLLIERRQEAAIRKASKQESHA